VQYDKEITKLEKSAVKLAVRIPKEEVVSQYNALLAKYAKSLQLPGFRKGHVPAPVLERKLGDALKQETSGELVEKSLTEIFEKIDEKPLPYSQPKLENDPKVDLNAGFEFEVTYEVFPAVPAITFEGVVLNDPQVAVGKAELEAELKQIQERNALVLDKKDEEVVAKGDIVTIDYWEVDEAGTEVPGSRRDDFVFTVGSGHLYQFDDDIVGMKKGETRQFLKTYADDAENGFAGKTLTFKVTAKAVKIRNLPDIDDELAQDVNEKYQTLADLKAALTKQLESQRDDRLRELKIESLLNQLVKKNPIELPESMLQAQLEMRWEQFLGQFGDRRQSESAFSKMKDGAMAEWRGATETQLKSRLIVEHLLKDRNIACAPEELEAEYGRIAERMEVSVEDVQKQYAEGSYKEYLADEVKDRKLYDELFKQVKVEKGGKMTFESLFAPPEHDHEGHGHEHSGEKA
jgi:trigger factor